MKINQLFVNTIVCLQPILGKIKAQVKHWLNMHGYLGMVVALWGIVCIFLFIKITCVRNDKLMPSLGNKNAYQGFKVNHFSCMFLKYHLGYQYKYNLTCKYNVNMHDEIK